MQAKATITSCVAALSHGKCHEQRTDTSESARVLLVATVPGGRGQVAHINQRMRRFQSALWGLNLQEQHALYFFFCDQGVRPQTHAAH